MSEEPAEAQHLIGMMASKTMDMVDTDEYLDHIHTFIDAVRDLHGYLVDQGFDTHDATRMIVGNLLGAFYPPASEVEHQ